MIVGVVVVILCLSIPVVIHLIGREEKLRLNRSTVLKYGSVAIAYVGITTLLRYLGFTEHNPIELLIKYGGLIVLFQGYRELWHGGSGDVPAAVVLIILGAMLSVSALEEIRIRLSAENQRVFAIVYWSLNLGALVFCAFVRPRWKSMKRSRDLRRN